MTTPQLTLHGYWRSSASWRVRIGLELKGLAYTYAAVHLAEGAQRGAEHLARNPAGLVPVLVVRDGAREHALIESLAILAFLDELAPAPALLPSDPYARAHVRAIAERVNAGIQPFQNLGTLAAIRARGADDKAWAAEWIAKGLGALEALVAPGAGAFTYGDTPGLADCCVIPQLYGARRFGVDLTPFPTLVRVDASAAAHPAFLRAHADVQPDASPTPVAAAPTR
jgi:maleylpyruvate isomerase